MVAKSKYLVTYHKKNLYGTSRYEIQQLQVHHLPSRQPAPQSAGSTHASLSEGLPEREDALLPELCTYRIA